MNRPATRGPLPTDTDINRLAAYPGIVGDTMQAAQLAADMEREIGCIRPWGCDQPAQWDGRVPCPHCGKTMVKGIRRFWLCDPHRTELLAVLAETWGGRVGRCLMCQGPVDLAGLHAAMHWERIK